MQRAHYWKAQELISLVSQRKLGQFFFSATGSSILFIFAINDLNDRNASRCYDLYIAVHAYLTKFATVADKNSVKVLSATREGNFCSEQQKSTTMTAIIPS